MKKLTMTATNSKSFKILVGFLLILLFGANAATAKKTTIVFSYFAADKGSTPNMYIEWFDEIRKRSDGELDIEPYWFGQLASLYETYQMVKEGVIDMGHVVPVMMPNQFPLEDIINFTSFDVRMANKNQFVWEFHNMNPEMSDPYDKVKLLMKFAQYPNVYTTIEGVEIRALDDCKGKKFFASGKWDRLKLRAQGFTTVTLSPQDTHMSAQTGVIDGGVLTLEGLFDMNLNEVMPNISYVNTRPYLTACVMNLDTWNKLPNRLKRVLTETANALPEKFDRILSERERELRRVIENDPRYHVFEFSKEELLKLSALDRPIREAFVKEMNSKGYDGDRLMRSFLELEKKYSEKERQ